jgi:hypothetical protein
VSEREAAIQRLRLEEAERAIRDIADLYDIRTRAGRERIKRRCREYIAKWRPETSK